MESERRRLRREKHVGACSLIRDDPGEGEANE